MDVGFSGLRFSLILLALFWVQDLVGKEIEKKSIIVYTAYPISRSQYLIGRYIGISGLLLTASLIFGLLLWLVVFAASNEYQQAHHGSLGIAYWAAIAGIWIDVIVVAAFALCIASISTVPALPLALGSAFAIAGHSIGSVLEYFAKGADGQQDLIHQFDSTLNFAKLVLPDLSRLDWRIWPMYDLTPQPESIAMSFLMALSYISLILMISIKALKSREFD